MNNEKNVEGLNVSPNDAKPNVKCSGGKLSKVQKELILQMRNGIICHYMQGLSARCFLARTHKNISWATIGKLEDMGLIERTDKYVVLTEKGRSHCI